MKALTLALLIAALPCTALGQAWTPRPGAPVVDPGRYQADQHRQAMAQLRAQADQREATARQLATETRLRRLELEAARRPEPVQPYAPRPPGSPEAERVAREAATARREALGAGTGQIDAWLDRRPD